MRARPRESPEVGAGRVLTLSVSVVHQEERRAAEERRATEEKAVRHTGIHGATLIFRFNFFFCFSLFFPSLFWESEDGS
jgi:hypothetical protein